MKPALLGVIVVGVIAVAGAMAFHFFPSEQSAFVSDCEAVLKERLRSPSTYKRITVSKLVRDEGSDDDYLDIHSAADRLEKNESYRRTPQMKEFDDAMIRMRRAGKLERLSIWLEYDAANGFGTPIRGHSECSYYIDKGTSYLKSRRFSNPRIDGKTALEWSLDGLTTG